MHARTLLATAMAVLVVATVAIPVAAAAESNDDQSTGASAYAGTHVSFDAEEDAIADYRVDGTTVAETVTVQSTSEAEAQSGLSVGAGIPAVTDVVAAGLTLEATTEVGATIAAESGATLSAHDNGHGSLVIAANGENQYVGINASQTATVESESDKRVLVTNDDGTETVVLVAGEGEVAVDEDGNVTSELESDSNLVVRTYGEARTEADREQEAMIERGTAAAQVYFDAARDGGDEAVSVVDYGQDTAVEARQEAESAVEMTVERAEDDGKVVIATVAESTVESVEDLRVNVDGEAAVEASSYGELESAADGGESSAYMVDSSSSAEAAADVYVALNHFSERSVTMDDDRAQSDDGAGDAGDADDFGPGFTVVGALAALAAIGSIALRRRA